MFTTSTLNRRPMPAIAAACDAQRDMEERRHLPRTLLGGTWAIRKTGEQYLPREPKEKEPAWNRRLRRTVLKNYYKKTLANLVGRCFTKPLNVTARNEDLTKMFEDIDKQGNHINVFAQTLLFEGMNDGLGFVHVEMPKRPIDPLTGEARRVSLSDMRTGGFRPYFRLVKAAQILGWRASTADGEPSLRMIRFRETMTVDAGEFTDKVLERIRVLDMVEVADATGQSVWRQRYRVYERIEGHQPLLTGRSPDPETEGYSLVDEGITTADEITFYPFYADRAGFMTGYPVLEDLAWMNLTHYQSYSDQRNILHVARVPILFGKGFEQDEDGKYEVSMEVGANIALYGPENSDMKYVEHNGNAIAAGQKDLDGLEAEMLTFGREFMMNRPSHESASARVIDHHEVNSPLKRVADAMCDCLENACRGMARYIDLLDEEDEPIVKTGAEIGLSIKDSQTVSNLIEMRREKMISHKTFLEELKNASVLSVDVNVDDEIKEVDKEKAAAAAEALEIARAQAVRTPGGNNDDEQPGNTPPPNNGGAPEGLPT